MDKPNLELIKPILVDSRFLRPLPKSMWDISCMACDKIQARWSLHEPTDTAAGETEASEDEVYVVCSLCFLYESGWGKARQDEIAALIRDAEKQREQGFMRKADNVRLMFPKDADSILSSIALVSRVFEIKRAQVQEAMAEQQKKDRILKK